jgi:hypothetical protein
MSMLGSNVRVGSVRPMSGGVTPPPTPPSYESHTERIKREREAGRAQNPDAWAYRESGLPSLLQAVPEAAWGFQDFLDQNLNVGRWFSGQPQIGASPQPTGRPTPSYSAGEGFYSTTAPTPQPPSRQEVAAQIAAMLGMGGGGGGGAARPDFSAYRAALTEQAQGLNAQIQAMYNALGEEAGANVGRIQDIYGGASTGIGDVYGSAIGNVGDAYSSAQQQAADQMARLGIEEAAPAVLNPMALSQAEAVSQLEQGQAGGLAATERFGSAASGFGSQMAQTAQQQGTEMNAAILASLQNRLAESLAAEQTGGGGGGGGRGASVSDQLRLMQYADEVYNRDVLGELPLDERKFGFQQAQAFAEPTNAARQTVLSMLNDLTYGKGVNGKRVPIEEAKRITASNLQAAGYPDNVIAPLLAEY